MENLVELKKEELREVDGGYLLFPIGMDYNWGGMWDDFVQGYIDGMNSEVG